MPSLESPPSPSLSKRREAERVLQTLHDFCAAQEAGAPFPSRSEWVKQLGTSERTVRWALDELQRQGKIVCRQGARAHVAKFTADGHAMRVVEQVGAGEELGCSVVAIAEPDGGVFDQAMQVLMRQGKGAKLAVHCRLMQEEEAINFLVPPVGAGPRGYILFRRQFLPLARRLQAAGHRVVLVGTPYADACVEVPIVFGDQEHGGYLAVKHLVELGHRRIAFHFKGDYRSLRRWAGCERALGEARQEGRAVLEEIWTGYNPYRIASQSNDLSSVRAYFDRKDAPTAIVSWNDDMAVKLLTLLLRAGVRVPEDVSLIGYDNLDRGAEVHPALTTVDGALDTQIQAALRWLSQPNPPSNSQPILVTPTLIRRDSSAPLGG